MSNTEPGLTWANTPEASETRKAIEHAASLVSSKNLRF